MTVQELLNKEAIIAAEPDEHFISISRYHDCLLLLTDRRLYRIENADDDILMRIHITSVLPLY